ncbi:MAG: VOC family protein [Chitinophagales bacterium]
MAPIISGIQQIGIGNPYVHEAWRWYREKFGMDVKIFDEAAEANLMLPYTGGKPHKRHAILAINMNGGGGFEIWQYTSRTPVPPSFEIQFGDLGIYVCKIKSRDINKTFDFLTKQQALILGGISKDPKGDLHFYVKDLYGNVFEIVKADDWFGKTNFTTGGCYGAVLGVTDMERSIKFYSEILGYDKLIYDKEETFEDTKVLAGGNSRSRRVLLAQSQQRRGPFSNLLGNGEIELIKIADRTPKKIFENRFWGDLGFIHLCFDIQGMNEMKQLCASKGYPFTVDSGDHFDMGEAAGHFSYIEDPDGALIEFVETHKVPILKKLGWYLNLQKRDPEKALPNWMIKAMGLNRTK